MNLPVSTGLRSVKTGVSFEPFCDYILKTSFVKWMFQHSAAPTVSWLCSLTLWGSLGPCLRLCSCSEMRKDAPPRALGRWCGLWSRCWQPELTVWSFDHLQCRQASLSEPEALAQRGHCMTIIATYLTFASVLKAFCRSSGGGWICRSKVLDGKLQI